MLTPMDRLFAEKFLTSVDDFYRYGTQLLFNEWWDTAPTDAVAKYVAAIESNPEQAALAKQAYYAKPLSLETIASYPAGTLGHAYHDFMVSNSLEPKLALGYRELHEKFAEDGKLEAMPPVMQYKVIRGYQTHDLHHVLTGYGATPMGELGLQGFQLAQMNYPYSAMIIATVVAHMTFVDPDLINPAMDAISEGWSYGRRARSIQFVAFEKRFGEPLDALRAEYDLLPLPEGPAARQYDKIPELTGSAN